MGDYEEKRELFLRAVRFVYERGGCEGVDRLTDTDPEELDRVWLDEDLEAFRELLRGRIRAALAQPEEAA